MALEFIQQLTESITGRTPHPEDAIFDGSQSAANHLSALISLVENPDDVTIKWDGYPALIFGRLSDGSIGIGDKYMFDKGVLVRNADEWLNYDSQKLAGGLRGNLYDAVAPLWAGLDRAVRSSGFFWADLMYSATPPLVEGSYSFKPNLVEYRIDATTELGKLIGASSSGVVVHQYFSEVGANPVQWNGSGLQNVAGGVAIIPPTAGNRYNLKTPVKQEHAASQAIKVYGTAVDSLLSALPKTTVAKIKTYFNKRVTRQTTQELHEWLEAQVSAKQFTALVGDDHSGLLFSENESGEKVKSAAYIGLVTIWDTMYAFKENIARQLESQTIGIQEFINGQPAGEGFVYPTSFGLAKIVDRGSFSAANFAKTPK